MLNLLDATYDEINNKYHEVKSEHEDVKGLIRNFKGCKKCKEFKNLQVDCERLRIYRDRLDKLRDEIPF